MYYCKKHNISSNPCKMCQLENPWCVKEWRIQAQKNEIEPFMDFIFLLFLPCLFLGFCIWIL